MNALLVGVASIVAFAAAFARLGTLEIARSALVHSRNSAALVMDRDLSDDDKERLVRKAAARMFLLLGTICFNMALVLAVAFVPVIFADWFGFATADNVARWFITPTGILLAILGFAVSWMVFAGRKRPV